MISNIINSEAFVLFVIVYIGALALCLIAAAYGPDGEP